MKTVVITGASQGLGLVLTKAFLKAEWEVVGTGRADRPESLPESVRYSRFDASDAAACEDFWRQVRAGHGGREVCLVNNAGAYTGGELLETSPEDFARQMQSNYFAAVYMTRGIVGAFASARILNIISAAALQPQKKHSAYGAAKAAEKYFFQSLQKDFVAEQYQITNLYPGDIATHEANPSAIAPADLAAFVLQLAEQQTSYYVADITLRPLKRD